LALFSKWGFSNKMKKILMIMGKCSNRIFNKIKINRQIKMKMMKVKL